MTDSAHSASIAIDRPTSTSAAMDPTASTAADALCSCLDDNPAAVWRSPLSSASSLPDFDPLATCVALIEDFEPGPNTALAATAVSKSYPEQALAEPAPWTPAPTPERPKYPITIATNSSRRHQQRLLPKPEPAVLEPAPSFLHPDDALKPADRPGPAFGPVKEPSLTPAKVVPGIPPTLLTSEDKLLELPMSTSPIVSPLSEKSDGWDLGATPATGLTSHQLDSVADCMTDGPRNREFPDKEFNGNVLRGSVRSSDIPPFPPAIARTLFSQTPHVQIDEAAPDLAQANPLYCPIAPQSTTITPTNTILPAVLPSPAYPPQPLPPLSAGAGSAISAAVLKPAPAAGDAQKQAQGPAGGETEGVEGTRIGKKRKPKRYSRPVASNFCHICARTQRDTQKTVCSNIHRQLCRKAVCRKCFKENGWDWQRASAPDSGWICPHCMSVCPSRARCHVYNRTNERRRLDSRRRKGRNNNAQQPPM